jgi:hypothetical protein
VQESQEESIVSQLILTAASGTYLSYVPLFKYCASRAYPMAAVSVVEYPGIPEYEAAIKRLLIVPEIKADEIYVTDVDMLLLKTPKNLFDQHSCLARVENTCYSSSVRRRETRGSERIQGLHYRTWKWYEKTLVARTKELDDLQDGKIGTDRIDDELSLMRVTVNSDLPIINYPGSLVDLHFGVHLGTIRAYKAHGRNAIYEQLRVRVSREMAAEIVSIETELKTCIDTSIEGSEKTAEEIKTLIEFCKGRMKGASNEAA